MSQDILIRSEARIRLTEKEKKTFIETELFADALEILGSSFQGSREPERQRMQYVLRISVFGLTDIKSCIL